MANTHQFASVVAAVLLGLLSVAAGQNTVMSMYPAGGSSPTSGPYAVPIGSTIVFVCSLNYYNGYFVNAQLHAQINGNDQIICTSGSTGSCNAGSQYGQFASRSLTVDVNYSRYGAAFNLTNAVVGDSLNYYCVININNNTYTGSWVALNVYSPPIAPTCSFTGSSNGVFYLGTILPSIQCSGNVGAPYGWLQVTTSGTIGVSLTSLYPSFLQLTSRTTTLLSNGTYQVSYTLAYQNSTGSLINYVLSASNNGDYITPYTYNWFGYNYFYGQSNSAFALGSVLPIIVQYNITSITITTSGTIGAVSSGYNFNYSVGATKGYTATLYCSAYGSLPTYTWTRISGQSPMLANGNAATVNFNYVETLVLQCNATNYITAVTPNYSTYLVSTVTIAISGSIPSASMVSAYTLILTACLSFFSRRYF